MTIWGLARKCFVTLGIVLLTLATIEVAFRVVYRDRGQRTMGGPGGRNFDYLFVNGTQRGRMDVGPRRPGVPRILAIGDSITYGQGVRDWRDTWPEILARRIEQGGQPVELAVLAAPGLNMREHLGHLEEWGGRVDPDVLVYQWYVNDIEVVLERPVVRAGWHGWWGHEWLTRRSYLYYTTDRLADRYLQGAPYLRYLLTDFQEGTAKWSHFERLFHAFAVRAQMLARWRVLMLYPQVPYREPYPLRSIHDRMRALGGPHELDIPPAAWIRRGGTLKADSAARWHECVEIPAEEHETVLETDEYLVLPGVLASTITYQGASAAEQTIGTLELVDVSSDAVIGSAPLEVGGHEGHYSAKAVMFEIAGPSPHAVRFRVRSSGGMAWRLADLAIRVDYGFDVVDLAQPLNTFETHVNWFDAHPNERAHRVMADEVYRALAAKGATGPPRHH